MQSVCHTEHAGDGGAGAGTAGATGAVLVVVVLLVLLLLVPLLLVMLVLVLHGLSCHAFLCNESYQKTLPTRPHQVRIYDLGRYCPRAPFRRIATPRAMWSQRRILTLTPIYNPEPTNELTLTLILTLT